MIRSMRLAAIIAALLGDIGVTAEPARLDDVSAEQAKLETQQLAAEQPHTFTEGMAEFRKTAQVVHYQASERRLPGRKSCRWFRNTRIRTLSTFAPARCRAWDRLPTRFCHA